MVELLRSNDLVLLSYIHALLKAEGIAFSDLDGHMNVLDGNINAFPRRLMVDDKDKAAAQALLRQADLGDVLSP